MDDHKMIHATKGVRRYWYSSNEIVPIIYDELDLYSEVCSRKIKGKYGFWIYGAVIPFLFDEADILML
jgi:hypothetical protein